MTALLEGDSVKDVFWYFFSAKEFPDWGAFQAVKVKPSLASGNGRKPEDKNASPSSICALLEICCSQTCRPG